MRAGLRAAAPLRRQRGSTCRRGVRQRRGQRRLELRPRQLHHRVQARRLLRATLTPIRPKRATSARRTAFLTGRTLAATTASRVPSAATGSATVPRSATARRSAAAIARLEPYCGDGVVSAGEDCDFGQFHSDDYGGCDAECHWASHCGDGSPDTEYEECDLGQGNTGSYDGCSQTCTAGPHCGDGVLQSDHDEACDNGFNEDDYAYTSSACGPSCAAVPYCGDRNGRARHRALRRRRGQQRQRATTAAARAASGVRTAATASRSRGRLRQGPRQHLVLGGRPRAAATTARSHRTVATACATVPSSATSVPRRTRARTAVATRTAPARPYCGDGKVQNKEGEECDGGPTGSLDCTPLCKSRSTVK